VYRLLPDAIGLGKIAAKLKELKIHGLLLVGGFEVTLFVFRLPDDVSFLTAIVNFFNTFYHVIHANFYYICY